MNDDRQHCAKLLSLTVHEFRNPVAVVSGYLRLLTKHFGESLTEQQRHLVQESEKSCGTVARLLQDLGELAALEEGTAAVRRQPVEIFSLLQEVAPNVHEGRDRGVTLEVAAPPEEALVSGDRARLAAALADVLHAALRERPGPGRVRVCGRLHRGGAPRAVIAVADPDRAAPFADGEGGDRGFDEYRGGLGFRLPIAARVVEALGGRLSSPVTERGHLAIVCSLPLASQDAETTG